MNIAKIVLVFLAALVTPTNADAQIQSLAASKVSDTSVTLTWQTIGSVASFNSPRREFGGVYGNSIALPGTATSVTHTGLKPATSYDFMVQARNAAGVLIGSSTVTAKTLAAPPPPPPATCGSGPAIQTISWSDNSSGTGQETGFVAEKSCDGGSTWTEAGRVATDVVTYVGSGLATGVNHCWRVGAYNSVGTNFSSVVCLVTTGTVALPAAPGLPSVINK